MTLFPGGFAPGTQKGTSDAHQQGVRQRYSRSEVRGTAGIVHTVGEPLQPPFDARQQQPRLFSAHAAGRSAECACRVAAIERLACTGGMNYIRQAARTFAASTLLSVAVTATATSAHAVAPGR